MCSRHHRLLIRYWSRTFPSSTEASTSQFTGPLHVSQNIRTRIIEARPSSTCKETSPSHPEWQERFLLKIAEEWKNNILKTIHFSKSSPEHRWNWPNFRCVPFIKHWLQTLDSFPLNTVIPFLNLGLRYKFTWWLTH